MRQQGMMHAMRHIEMEYAKNGWKKENDLVLKIGFDSSGLYDIGQERGYGATQNMWMKGISQSIFEASV